MRSFEIQERLIRIHTYRYALYAFIACVPFPRKTSSLIFLVLIATYSNDIRNTVFYDEKRKVNLV